MVYNLWMLLSTQKTEKVFLLTMDTVISSKQRWLCNITEQTVKVQTLKKVNNQPDQWNDSMKIKSLLKWSKKDSKLMNQDYP